MILTHYEVIPGVKLQKHECPAPLLDKAPRVTPTAQQHIPQMDQVLDAQEWEAWKSVLPRGMVSDLSCLY